MPVGSAHWRALGTNVDLLTVDPTAIDRARAAVVAELDAIDQAYSRFRPDSELQRLHERPGRAVRISPLLFRAIDTALSAARLTGGAVDPTVGGTLRRLGYDRDFFTISPATTPLTFVVEEIPGWRTIHLDPVARTVRVPRGVELDLGSTGKALAADLAASAAHRVVSSAVLVSLGGDIAAAGAPPTGGWRVLIAESSVASPEDDADGEVIAIGPDAVATSSTTIRRWSAAGVIRHHIIDPATGLPAAGPWRTVSVVAGTCVDANTVSTAAIVKGAAAPDWLRTIGLPARLVSTDAAVVRVGGWPAPLERAS